METHEKPDLVLFDFDGTLTTKDTMIEFIRFVRGGARLQLGFLILAPVLVLYKLGLIRNDRAKEILLDFHFKGQSKTELEKLAQSFFEQRLPGILRPQGLERLREHQESGARVLLVSASLRLWTQPFAKAHGMELLTTEGEWVEGKFSGKLQSLNCYGPEKVRRVKAHLNPDAYCKVVAYGDSKGDREMLAWADAGHFRPFREIKKRAAPEGNP